jgi:hypothetical protein
MPQTFAYEGRDDRVCAAIGTSIDPDENNRLGRCLRL